MELLEHCFDWLQILVNRLTADEIMAAEKDLNTSDERMHPKNGLSKRRHYSCTSYGIWDLAIVLFIQARTF